MIPSNLRHTLAVLETVLVGLLSAGAAGAADAVLASRPVTAKELLRTAAVGAVIGVAALVRRSPWAPPPTTPTAEPSPQGVPR